MDKRNITYRGVIVIVLCMFFPSLLPAQMNTMDMSMDKTGTVQQEIPPDLDMSTVKQSKANNYVLKYKIRGEQIKLNTLHSWKFTLKSSEGKAVGGARIIVQGEMPGHRHGLKTKPRMTYASGKNGIYIVEGMLFQMPGWWEVTCRILKGQDEDTVIYNIIVE